MSDRSLRLTIFGLFLLIPIVVFSIIIISAATGGLAGWYWWPMGSMGGIGWIFLLIPLTVFIIIFVISMSAAARPGSWRLYQWGPWGGWTFPEHNDAEAILEERYAKGEISREDFLRMKEDLRANRR